MHTLRRRRLVDTASMTARSVTQADLTGELLPAADDTALVPWQESASWRQPAAPIITVNLPRARADDDAPGVMTWERRTLQREPNLETDLVLPVLQAGAVALAVLILVGLSAWVFGWSWRVVAVTFGAALALTLLARFRFMDSLLWATETLTGHDMNGDGKVGNPAQSFALVNPAQARTEAAKTVQTTESAAQRAELLAFVHRCYVTGTAETAHGVKAGGPDRTEYLKRRDVLLSLGIAAWKNPQRPKAGWKMAVSHQRALDIIGKHVL